MKEIYLKDKENHETLGIICIDSDVKIQSIESVINKIYDNWKRRLDSITLTEFIRHNLPKEWNAYFYKETEVNEIYI